jgi:hypothetical protein
MAFKGLEDRFTEKAHDLYRKYSTTDGANHNLGAPQPFLEIKPDDSNASETTSDSRSLPIFSTKRDLIRIGKFSKMGGGLLWLAKQELLQTGNTFNETRIINPLFVLQNTVPFTHARRTFRSASNQTPDGDITRKSPASDEQVGAAGRLQLATARAAIQNVVGKSSTDSLLSLVSGNFFTQIVDIISDTIQGSIEGIDERPELNVNGEYFSVLVWKGFSKRHSFTSDANAVFQNLLSGNIKGAINAFSRLRSTIKDDISNLRGKVNGNSIDGRGDRYSGAQGRRYFITDSGNADRYLEDSIIFRADASGHEVPVVHITYLDRKPWRLEGDHDIMPTVTGKTLTISDKVNSFTSKTNDLFKKVENAIRNPVGSILGTIPKKTLVGQLLTDAAKDVLGGKLDPQDNPAENNMLFPGVSLTGYYNDTRFDDIRDAIKNQQETQTKYWDTVNQAPKLGFEGGLKAGESIDIDPKIRNKSRRYFHDKMNETGVISNGADDLIVPDSMINDLRKTYGRDLINIFFFDFVNKKTVPFRAFIANVTENVNPEFRDTKYIGRIERNVVYTGVQRDLSFTLHVYAFSESEMTKIWEKINYMTGLCYPAAYEQNGFMVPPFIKMTMGDYYRDQPGYLRNLTYVIDDNTSWNIDDNAQAPYGVTMNISFAVIEKTQAQAGTTFYPYNRPRDPKSVLDKQKLAPLSLKNIFNVSS